MRRVLGAVAAAPVLSSALRAQVRPIVIGAKTFTEQYVLSELLAQWIARTTGLPTEIRASLGSTVAYDALASGDVDVYVDYSGTLWATILKRPEPPASRAAALDEIARFVRERDGIELVCDLGFENAYALAMRARDAERLGVRTIGDLAPHAPRMTIGGDYEFFSRPEWRSVRDTYGLRFASERSMDSSLMYGAIPPYDAIVLASARLGREHPDVVAALRRLARTIDAGAMRAANLAVDQQKRAPSEVARGMLEGIEAATGAPAAHGARDAGP